MFTLTVRSRPSLLGGAAALVALLAACGSTPNPVAPTTLALRSHAAFFSSESHLPRAIDPQMFEAVPGAPAGVGPQGIAHAAGFEPVAEDGPAGTALYAADGSPLHVNLGEWEAARGTVTLSCSHGSAHATARLSHLIPGGVYSLFVVHLTATTDAARFTPLGTNDTATASPGGSLTISSTTSPCLNGTEAILVVWHSDGTAHGASPGQLGVTQHNSLIVAVPAHGLT